MTKAASATQPWPKTMAERTKAVDAALATEKKPITAAALAKRFVRAKPTGIGEILTTMAVLGRARRSEDGERWMR